MTNGKSKKQNHLMFKDSVTCLCVIFHFFSDIFLIINNKFSIIKNEIFRNHQILPRKSLDALGILQSDNRETK